MKIFIWVNEYVPLPVSTYSVQIKRKIMIYRLYIQKQRQTYIDNFYLVLDG